MRAQNVIPHWERFKLDNVCVGGEGWCGQAGVYSRATHALLSLRAAYNHCALVGTISPLFGMAMLVSMAYCPCTRIHKLIAYFYAVPENATGRLCSTASGACTAHGCKLQQSFDLQQQQEYTRILTRIHSSFLGICKLYYRVFIHLSILNYKLPLELVFFDNLT